MNLNKIAIVIVTYNRLEIFKKCMKKIENQNIADVLIIDNASTDGTREYIKSKTNYNIRYYNTGKYWIFL